MHQEFITAHDMKIEVIGEHQIQGLRSRRIQGGSNLRDGVGANTRLATCNPLVAHVEVRNVRTHLVIYNLSTLVPFLQNRE